MGIQTVQLEKRWVEIRGPKFKPPTMRDEMRVRLLSGNPISVEGMGREERQQIGAVVREFRFLGFDLDDFRNRAARTVTVKNPAHNPTPAQFAEERASRGVDRRTTSIAAARANGHAPARRVGNASVRAMFPDLGESLTVTLIGFDDDGPVLGLVGREGWRYRCVIESANPPRGAA